MLLTCVLHGRLHVCVGYLHITRADWNTVSSEYNVGGRKSVEMKCYAPSAQKSDRSWAVSNATNCTPNNKELFDNLMSVGPCIIVITEE